MPQVIFGRPHSIYSYDTNFDRFPDITRKEPEEIEESAA
jgi:hypothetical protein